MAVGLACALAAGGGSSSVTLAGAMALCLGMGLQNFRGAAISLPCCGARGFPSKELCLWCALRYRGAHRRHPGGAYRESSVTPLNALVSQLCCGRDDLCGGRGADSEAHLGSIPPGTAGCAGGALVMMVLDVALGVTDGTEAIFRRARPGGRGTLSGFTIPIPVFERHLGCRAVDGTFVLQEWRADEKGRVFHYGHRMRRPERPLIHRLQDFWSLFIFSLFLLDAALQGKAWERNCTGVWRKCSAAGGAKGIRIDVVDD